MQYFKNYREHFGTSASKPYRTSLFESGQLKVGLYCLEPGQAQPQHAHAAQDTFYLVLEGEGTFTVGSEQSLEGEGTVIWAPAGVEHGVQNTGTASLVLFVGIAPTSAS